VFYRSLSSQQNHPSKPKNPKTSPNPSLLYDYNMQKPLYAGLANIDMHDSICTQQDILYTCTTKLQEKQKNGKPTKTSTNQTSKRPIRPYNSAVPKSAVHARLPGHNQDKKKLWRLLWAKHHLSAIVFFGEEGAGE
jgi:hypothetical protein